jgi:hypothetical protein
VTKGRSVSTSCGWTSSASKTIWTSALLGGVEQVLHHLLLAVDHDGRAAGQAAMSMRNISPSQARLVPPWTSPSRRIRSAITQAVHQVDGDLLQHAGPDAALDIGAVRRSSTTASTPARFSRWPGTIRPDPAPMMATWVRTMELSAG